VTETVTCDIAIIGSGMGGGATAWALRESGADVVVVERGGRLPREPANWSAAEVFRKTRYRNAEPWFDEIHQAEFHPGVYYYIGGNTKVYGACLPRFRETDFGVVEHLDGRSPAWPVSYSQMEPYYVRAEQLLLVHGSPGEDPTEPWRSADYPQPALADEPTIERLRHSLNAQGLRPFYLPMGVDRREGGSCIRCATCDGFPCKVDAKSDADVRLIRPAVDAGVRLLEHTRVRRLESDGDGSHVTSAIAENDDGEVRINAKRYVLAAGAVNTAALLLASGNANHPNGLANSSGLVGRRYMVHNSTFMMAVDPRRRSEGGFQKTLGVNDWYVAGPHCDVPLGNLQMLGKLQADIVKPARTWVPMPALRFVTGHSVDIYLTTEDLPDTNNRVVIRADGRIGIYWTPNNLEAHRRLVARVSAVMRKAGYPIILTERMNIATNSHQCGTAVMGDDPEASVVDSRCRSHDVENLWISDSSVFPSSAAMNPALTIAANALRVADNGSLLN
jgi:choline dehydrogenase-like flavoprotein